MGPLYVEQSKESFQLYIPNVYSTAVNRTVD